MGESIDLGKLFQTVTRDLVKNQQVLNQADDYNQNHGDNMVRTFQTITKAVQLKQKQGSSDSAALAYAAKRLAKSGSGASAQLYSQSLTRAAEQFKGKAVDQRGAMSLLQTLIGGGAGGAQSTQASAGGDLLGSLLGGMAGGSEGPGASSGSADLLGSLLGGMMGGSEQPSAPSGGGDLLGSLLGGMMGGSEGQSSVPAPSGDLLGSLLGGLSGSSGSSGGLQDGLDLGDLLNVGMTFMQYKQQGKSTLEALVAAFMAMSGMGKSKDRTQSTQLVVSSFLKALGAGQ